MVVAAVFGLVLMVGAPAARADSDRCSSLSAAQATKAATLLPRRSQVVRYCQPCGDAAVGETVTVDEVAVVGSGTDPRTLRINNQAISPSYTYYLSRYGEWHNLAFQAGCAAKGVAAKLTPSTKRYKLGLTIEILPLQADGSSWDMDSYADPLLHGGLFQGSRQVRALGCEQSNTRVVTCLSGTVVDVDENTILSLVLQDYDDVSGNEDIGTVGASLWDAALRPGKAITATRTTGQIKSATLSLTPVE